MSDQNNIEHIKDQLERGLIISADQANVEMVRSQRIRIVTKLSRDIRTALNVAVKNGELEHLKKAGRKPEVYFHPAFGHLAIEARSKAERKVVQAMLATCA